MAFKKGQSGNPRGRPPMPDYLHKGMRMNKVEFQNILQKYINCNLYTLKTKLEESKEQNSKTTAMEVIVIKILVESIKRGDTRRLDFVLDRLIGKVKEHVEISGDLELTKKVDLSLLTGDELENLEKMLKKC